MIIDFFQLIACLSTSSHFIRLLLTADVCEAHMAARKPCCPEIPKLDISEPKVSANIEVDKVHK